MWRPQRKHWVRPVSIEVVRARRTLPTLIQSKTYGPNHGIDFDEQLSPNECLASNIPGQLL
jgi:hypothetical protein